MKQLPDSNPDHGQTFNIGELIDKLKNSPRKADGSPKGNESSRHQVEDDLKCTEEGSTSMIKVEGRDEEQENQDHNMAWKSDLHGFYQSSKNNGFLYRFQGHDEEQPEEDRIKHTFDTNNKNYDQKLHDEKFSFVEIVDNSELFTNEGEVKDVKDATAVQNVPLVFIQPPTPSYLSSQSTSSIGSSRPETPEPDDNEAALNNEEPRLASDEEQSEQLPEHVLQQESKNMTVEDGGSVMLVGGRVNQSAVLPTEKVVENEEEKLKEMDSKYGFLNRENEMLMRLEDNEGRREEEMEEKQEENDIRKVYNEEDYKEVQEEENNEFISNGIGGNEEKIRWKESIEDIKDDETNNIDKSNYGMEFVVERKKEDNDEYLCSKEYENLLMEFEKEEDNDDTKKNFDTVGPLNFEPVSLVDDAFEAAWSTKLPRNSEVLDENENESILDICNGITHPVSEAVDDETSLRYGRNPVYDEHNNSPVYDNNRNDSSNSVDHANSTLLTSWTEQQIKNEISITDASDTVTFGHRTDDSPTITWRTKSTGKPIDTISDSPVDSGNDILQTSIGSATDLREILERSLQRQLDSFEENENDEGHLNEEGAIESLEKRSWQLKDEEDGAPGRFRMEHVDEWDDSEQYDDRTHSTDKENLFCNDTEENRILKDESLDESGKFTEQEDNDRRSSVNVEISDELLHHRAITGTFTESDDVNFVPRWKRNGALIKDCRFAQNMPDEFMMCLEDLEAISLLRSVEVERVRLETLAVIRSKMEETCNGMPIDRVPSFVYSQWEDLFRSLAEEENINLKEIQTEHENSLMDMRLELDKLTKDNLNLSKIATENNSSKLENELLRRQIGGLEEFVTSLERRIDGRAKENAKLIEEINELRSVSAVKENDLRIMVKNCENELKEARSEIDVLKKNAMNLENEIKMKEIENRRILAENEKVKDEVQYDFENMNSNIKTLRSKLMDLQNENHTFRTANEADQTIIKHLEAKLQTANEDLAKMRNEKNRLLAELEGSRIREADVRKKQYITEKERSDLEIEKSKILEKSRMLQEEKLSIEKKLNERLSTDVKNAEAMLQEIESLESSLNSVRNEKAHVEDKYNNLKFELEREHLIGNRKKQTSEIYNSELKQSRKRPDDFEIEENDQLADSVGLLGPKYSVTPQFFVDKSLSLETSEPRSSTLSSTVTMRPLDPKQSSGGDFSHLSINSRSPSSLFKANSPDDSLSTLQSRSTSNRHFGNSFLLNVSYPEDPRRSLDRKLAPDSGLISPKIPDPTFQGKPVTSTVKLGDSDGESVDSYLDFPRDLPYLPSVLVVRSNASPSMRNQSNVTFKHTPGHAGDGKIKHHAHSRLAEREDYKLPSGNMDFTKGNANSEELVHQDADENRKSISYSAEDTRLWLRSMETKLEQTDQIIKAMKSSKHIKV